MSRRLCAVLRAAPVVALLAVLSPLASAQPMASSLHQSPFAAYDKAHETTLNGIISQLTTHPTPGSLLGLHMMVASGGATHDVHLGSYLPKDVTQNVLRSNQPVQVVGMNVTLHGKSVLLARQVITAGRLITVRDGHGFLVSPAAHAGRRAHHAGPAFTGGRQ